MEDLRTMLEQNIDEELLIKLTKDMVSIESHPLIPCQETAVAEYIKEFFDGEGIPCYTKEVKDGRSNVVATLDSGKPGRTLMLNGHTDTVKEDGMVNAFRPWIEDGKLYGRGSSDMKGPLASAMVAMKILKDLDLLKEGKVIFTGVCDEEQNSIGSIDILETGVTADGIIVCEPTELKVCNGNRGLEWFEFKFIGKTVHGGEQEKGINAIAKAVDFINVLEGGFIDRVKAKGGTVNYGVIKGGTQLSTVAGECILLVDRRYTANETYEEMCQEFREVLDDLAAKDPKFRCEMSVLDVSVMKEGYVHEPAFTELTDDIVTMTKVHTLEYVEDYDVEFIKAWTDAGLFSTYGKTPVIIMGPGIMECCHSEHEYIPVDHLKKAAVIYCEVALDYCTSKE
ncbi:MAG: M20 family metallopeptidase [Firmicutes bacterium]|nr:M20 family metallopeptidase [Bacillota bacterium]